MNNNSEVITTVFFEWMVEVRKPRPEVGFEPTTLGLVLRCSPNWVTHRRLTYTKWIIINKGGMYGAVQKWRHQGREGGRSTKTVTSIDSDCKFYCFHGDKGGWEVWIWSFLRWLHFWMATINIRSIHFRATDLCWVRTSSTGQLFGSVIL